SIFFEIAWVGTLKYTDGFTRLFPTLLNILLGIGSFYFFGCAVKSLPLGAAYAVWTGASTLGIVAIGILCYHESKSPLHLLFIFLIVVVFAGLKLIGPQS